MTMTPGLTESQRVEQESLLLASIVKHSNDAIISKTLDGVILSWNSAAERIYGYSAKEAIGQSISILVPPDYPDEVSKILEKIKQGEGVDHYETVRMRKDGRQVAVSLTISPIKDISGNIIAASIIVRDVTKHKHVEETLQQRTQELGERVKELNCLYAISSVHGKQNLSLDQILQTTIDLIPPAWQFPKITWAQLILSRQLYRTNNYRETNCKQVSDIFVHGKRVGVLEVGYLEEREDKSENPFLEEEQNLINMIAIQLGKTIERKQAEEALQKAHNELELRVEQRTHEIERRRQVAESLRDILAILNSNRPVDEILDYIVAQASWLLDADAGAVYHLQDKDKLLTIQAARGLDQDYAVGMTIPAGQGITGQAALARRPVVTSNTTLYFSDLMNTDEATLKLQQQLFLKYLANRFGAMLAVPLIVKDKVYGTISLYYYEPREFSDEEIGLTAAFGDQATLAIENARLRTQVKETAIAAERHRLARDLHDAVTQTLFSASLIAEMLPRVWERYPDEARNSLEELRQLTRGALAEMRTLLLELRPAALTEAKLDRVLGHLAEAITSRTRVPVSLAVEGDCTFPPDVQIALYRIAQEALNNAAKHAKATQATIALRCQPEQAELSVSDNGRGFDPASISPDHLGLGIMYERARAIGAELEIKSQPDSGTQVVVTWQKTGKQHE